MQSVSATLAAAIAAFHRRPLARVLVDWTANGNYTDAYDDLSATVESLSVDRAITTDLPDASSLIAGNASARAQVVLSGHASDGTPIANLLSPYSGKIATRLTRMVDVDLGMVTDAGEEWVDSLVGTVREVSVDPSQQQVALDILDGRDRLWAMPRLPAIVNVEPWGGVNQARSSGLNSQWVLDRIARHNGFYASPAQRTGSVFLATFHGAAYAELPSAPPVNDKPFWIHGLPALGAAYPSGPPIYTAMGGGLLGIVAGPASPSIHPGGIDGAWSLVDPTTSLGSTSNISFECRVRRVSLTAGPCYLAVIDASPVNGADVVYISLSSAAGLKIEMRRGGTQGTLTLGPNGSTYPTGSDYFVGVHLLSTSTGATVNVRVNGTTYSGTLTGVDNPTSRPRLTRYRLLTNASQQGTMAIRDVQITSGQAWTSSFFSATENHVPTALLEPGLNYMLGTPMTPSGDGWTVAQDVAAAEAGVVLFDESDRFTFYNRNHMVGGTSVATVTSTRSITSLASVESVDSVRNRIRVPAEPLKLQPINTYLWQAQETLAISASSSIAVFIEFPGVVWNVDGIFVLASVSPDGKGGDATSITPVLTYTSNSSGILTITNGNAFPVYLVANSTAALAERGNPYVIITGQCIAGYDAGSFRTADGGYLHELADNASITTYREQVLNVEESPWRQTVDQAASLCTALLAKLKDPHPVLTNVGIVGDPRLQLADRITVVEPDTLAVSGDFWVIGTTTQIGPGGLTQSLALRAV